MGQSKAEGKLVVCYFARLPLICFVSISGHWNPEHRDFPEEHADAYTALMAAWSSYGRDHCPSKYITREC